MQRGADRGERDHRANLLVRLCAAGAFCAQGAFVIPACASSPADPAEPVRLITGRITVQPGAPVAAARVTLAGVPRGEVVYSDNDGVYTLDSIPPGRQTLRVERVGYQQYLAPVPNPVNGIAVMNPVLSRVSGNVPAVKPLGTGMVRVRGRVLETDFDRDGAYAPFLVKGAAYSPVPIQGAVTRQTDERSMLYLVQMHANTIRTYSGASPALLEVAAQNNIRVIVGFWVDFSLNLDDPSVRSQVKEQFGTMVIELKDSPAVLFWNLGNEQNYGNGNSPGWYTLVQELAVVAYQTEGAAYHPVCASNGAFSNIGSAAMNADDASLSYMDLWAVNAYAFDLAAGVNSVRAKTAKPVVLTEFGIDALDNRTRTEYEDEQARFDSTNWTQILSVQDICVGGTVFEFLDEWWKAGNPPAHDFGGYATAAHPDGYSNEEWWGLIAVTPDADGDGLDDWRPRRVCTMFQRAWQ